MGLQPAAIAAANAGLANKPILGGNVEIYATDVLSYRIGVLEITAADTGVWTPDAENAAVLSADPSDLVAVCQTRVNGGAENIVLTVTGTDDGDAAASGVATFDNPSYSPVTKFFFPRGYGKDVVEGEADIFKTVTGVAATNATATAINSKFEIWKLPAFSDFIKFGCREEFSFSTPDRVPQSIPCGFNATAYSVPGSSEELNIDLSGKYFTIHDSLARYAGAPITLMARIIKEDGTLEVDRWFFTGVNLARNFRAPVGSDAVVVEATGKYENLIVLSANGA